MDLVFRALADPTRRALLDALFVRDGQTLLELCEAQAMTRFGVMKHLKLLEEANLVVARKSGREKLHYLNPIPIRMIHDRWIGKYAEPWVQGLVELKHHLEEQPCPATSAPTTSIRSTSAPPRTRSGPRSPKATSRESTSSGAPSRASGRRAQRSSSKAPKPSA